MHAPWQEVTGGHDGPRGGGARQSSSEFGLQPERHSRRKLRFRPSMKGNVSKPTVCLSNVPLVYCHINRFQQVPRLGRPSQGGEKRIAVQASHQEEL
jgi:hypothetical protein